MVTSPTEQFERIKQHPIFWKALMIVIMITVIGLWLTSFGVELPDINNLSEEEIVIAKMLSYIGIFILGLVTTVVSILMTTIIFYLFTKVVQANVTFKQLYSMNTYIMLITAISMVVNGIIIALIGNYSENEPLYTSLAGYIKVNGGLAVLFNNIEIFSIWTLILTAIGLHKVTGISKRLAWTIAALFFAIGIISAIVGLDG